MILYQIFFFQLFVMVRLEFENFVGVLILLLRNQSKILIDKIKAFAKQLFLMTIEFLF